MRSRHLISHDDVIGWKHFPRYWPFVRGIHRWPVNSPHKCQWREAFIFSLICAWTNGSVNNRDVSDLRLHRAHYDVIVMRPKLHCRSIILDAQSANMQSHKNSFGELAKHKGKPWPFLYHSLAYRYTTVLCRDQPKYLYDMNMMNADLTALFLPFLICFPSVAILSFKFFILNLTIFFLQSHINIILYSYCRFLQYVDRW